MKCKKRYAVFLTSLMALFLGGYLLFFGTEKLAFPENQTGKAMALEMDENFKQIEMLSLSEDSKEEQRNEISHSSYISSNSFFVSLTKYKGDCFLATDYTNIYKIYKDSWEYLPLESPQGYVVWSEVQEEKKSFAWNPTGICYDNENDLIYIANYNGHNILVARLEENDNLTIVDEFVCDGLISPENVAVSKDGSKIAVADYDGNALFLFDKDGDLIWKRMVGLAHGVAMDDSYVYGTGLEERKIIKFDFDGNLIGETGVIGLEGQNSYLWPTFIENCEDKLLVTDAHTGRISLLDKELNFISSIGGLGPSVNTLNFPYCTIEEDGFLYTTDTFNRRILKLSMDGKLINSAGLFESEDMPEDVLISSFGRGGGYTYGELDQINPSVFNPYLKNEKAISAYGAINLYHQDNSLFKTVYLSDYAANETLSYKTPHFEQLYITWMHEVNYQGKEFYVIGSPQRSFYYYVWNESDQIFFPVYLNYPTDPIWIVNNKMYSKKDPQETLRSVVEQGIPYIKDFLEMTKTGTVSRRDAYIKSFLPYYNEVWDTNLEEEQMKEWLELSFITEEGKTFWMEYENAEDIAALTDEYLFQMSHSNSYYYLTELFFVRTFGNFDKENMGVAESISLELNVLDSAATYDGYGVENSLDQDPNDDYTAFLETESEQYFVIGFEKPVTIGALQFTFDSPDNFVSKYELIFYLEGKEILRQSVTDQLQYQQMISCDSVRADSFRVTALQFKGQKRILMREIKVFGNAG